MHAPGYYRLAPGVDAVPLADGALLFRSSTLALRVEGNSASFLAERVVPLLGECRSLDELSKRIPDLEQEELKRALDALVDARALERLDSVEPRDPHSAFFRGLGVPPESARERLQSATVAVFGLEAHGAHLAVALSRLGLGNCVLADPFPLLEADLPLMPEVAGTHGVTRQQAVADAIAKVAPATQIRLAGAMSRESVQALVEGASVLVGCFDRGYETAQHWINRAAVAARIPAVYAEIGTHLAIAGPTVLPGQTACYMCYRMRRVACEENYDEAMAYERFVNARNSPGLSARAAAPSLPPYLSSLLTSEIVKLVVLGLPSSLAGRILEFDALTLESSFHAILRQPECPVCAEKKKQAGRFNPDLSGLRTAATRDTSGDLRALTDRLVSLRTGVVRRFEPFVKDSVEPHVPYIVRADVSNHRFISRRDDDGDICSGKGMTLEDARVSALGEAVERYSGAVHSPAELLYARRSELHEPSLDPQQLVLFHESQYQGLPYAAYADNRIGWVPARSLVSGRELLVPAMAVFMNLHAHDDGEYIAPITSNGLAAGRTLLDAVWGAASEVLERDAFMIAWLNRLPATRVTVLNHPDRDVAGLAALYARRGVELRLYRLPTDHDIAVFAAVALEAADHGGPAAVFGLGVDLHPVVASRKAVLEVCQVRPALRRRLRRPETAARLVELLEDPRRVATINDHDLLYASRAALPRLAFWLDLEEQPFDWQDVSNEARSESLPRFVEWLTATGHDLLYVNLTPADMAEFGLYTARAILPGFQPIDFGWKERRLGGRRVHEIPVRLGFRQHPGDVAGLNPDPHPLA